MRTRTMKPLFLIFCLCLSPLLMGQNQNKIQEAMANYDYETAVELILSLIHIWSKSRRGTYGRRDTRIFEYAEASLFVPHP